jgi:hypothetical protein
VRGLLAPLAGKNGWRLAEAAGDLTPGGMQRLLNAAAWDTDGARDDLRDYAVTHLGERGGVLIVDETGFIKKGCKSADHHHPRPGRDLGLVPLVPTTPIPRPTSPLPATIHPRSPSAAEY